MYVCSEVPLSQTSFLWMAHRTRAVEELLESEDITRMDCPAYSPDLNPIEHVWYALGRRIAACLHHPENTQQLKQMLIEEWVLLPQEMLHQLVLSMRRRCKATIADVYWFGEVLVQLEYVLFVSKGIGSDIVTFLRFEGDPICETLDMSTFNKMTQNLILPDIVLTYFDKEGVRLLP
ncbi:transposable element Tc1 transposase [Trichonephila clavipes]|uniref:Transposable element Tc1 transposase n=1 Tax=Trichonephila clavipes TaxID=2585209 RepID=A0A8X6VN12_TRICX|nr:transposable element Tc1 transposase [Trichonephila clavipes]